MDRFYWNYETPGGFTDLIMYSDGRFLTGLVFEKSADGFKNRWDKIKDRNAGGGEKAEPHGEAEQICAVGNQFQAEQTDPEDTGVPGYGMIKELLPVFEDTILWLDMYFGKDAETGKFTVKSVWPDFAPAMKIEGLTPFRRKVMTTMISIPFGQTMTYGEIANVMGKKKMSARAVGGAVGWNPICIIIPCHRVLGTNGSITGYGGGIENKIALLKLEGIML